MIVLSIIIIITKIIIIIMIIRTIPQQDWSSDQGVSIKNKWTNKNKKVRMMVCIIIVIIIIITQDNHCSPAFVLW